MPKHPARTFTTLDSTALTTVTGGRRSSSSSSATDDRMMDMLDNIQSAIKDVGSKNSNANNPMSQMMPILALSMMNQQQPPPPPQAPQVIVVRRGRRC